MNEHRELQLAGNLQSFVGAAVVNENDLIHDFVGDGLVSDFEGFGSIVRGHNHDDFGPVGLRGVE
jgi:hypothetical protein